MALEAGAVDVRIGASIDGLRSGLTQATNALRAFELTSQRSLERALDGSGIAPSVRRGVEQAVGEIRRTLDRGLSDARDSMNRGIIDRDEFVRRTQRAGEDAADAMRRSFERLSATGLLPPAVASRLTEDLSAAARKAGEEAGRQMTDALAERLEGIGRPLQTIGRRMTLGITAPLVGFGALALKASADFERSMNKVQALSGATGSALNDLSQQAQELGRTTQYSASQAADGMGFLAMAGFEASQILAAMPSTLQLAAAAQMDLATAADITSNILTGYALPVEELGRANDVLVRTFTRSNTSLQQLGEAMKYVGPLAAGLGIEFEEVAAAIGLFGNAGIQGSMAGTSLRRALSSLSNPTAAVASTINRLGLNVRQADGSMRPLVEILEQLERAGADTTDMMVLFGDRGGPAMAALLEQGSTALRNFTADLEESGGTAERIAAAQMRGLSGATLELKSALEGLQIAVTSGGALAGVTGLVRSVAGGVQDMAEMSDNTANWAIAIGATAAAMGPLAAGIGAVTLATRGLMMTLSVGLGPLIAVGGPIALGLAAISTLFIKAKLDAAAAGEAFVSAMADAAEAGAQFERTQLAALNAAISQARVEQQTARETLAVLESRQARILESGPFTTGSAKGREYRQLSEEIERAGKVAEAAGMRYDSLLERRRELLTPPADPVDLGTEGAAAAVEADVAKINAALKTLEDNSAVVTALRAMGLGIDEVGDVMRRAAAEATRAEREFRTAQDALRLLGDDAPEGAQEYVESLGRHAADTRAEVEKLAASWRRAMDDMESYQPGVVTPQTLPPNLGRTVAGIEAEFERAMVGIRENFARGLISRSDMDAQGREAAQAFNRALLAHIDSVELSPRVRADLVAKLKIEAIEDGAGWREFSDAAAVAAMGIVNVADAFGEMDERARRAVTGLSELARSVGTLQTSGGLFQAANIGPLIGIAGGIAQVIGSALQSDPADQQAIESNTQALDKLRLAVEGWRATAASLDRAMQLATRLRDDERTRAAIYNVQYGDQAMRAAGQRRFEEFERWLRSLGLSLRELDALAAEHGLNLYHKSGRLSVEALDQLIESLDLAGAMLTGFADNVEGERQRLSLLDRIEGRTTLEPLDALDRELSLLKDAAPELFNRFFAGIDIASEEGRQQAREALRRMFDSFEGDDFAKWMGELTRDDILEFFGNTADGLNKLEEAANSTASSLSNVPPIFDLALRRRDAMLGDFGLGSDIRFPQPPDLQPVQDTFDRLTVASGAVDSFTDSLESAWERITRFGDAFRGGATDWHLPTPVREYEERLQTLQVNIHNPPAGMDVREVTRQVTKGIVENLQRGGASELSVALRMP